MSYESTWIAKFEKFKNVIDPSSCSWRALWRASALDMRNLGSYTWFPSLVVVLARYRPYIVKRMRRCAGKWQFESFFNM